MTNGQDWEDYRKDMQPGLHSKKENLTDWAKMNLDYVAV